MEKCCRTCRNWNAFNDAVRFSPTGTCKCLVIPDRQMYDPEKKPLNHTHITSDDANIRNCLRDKNWNVEFLTDPEFYCNKYEAIDAPANP